MLGVVPYAGDAVAIPGKAARFVVRNADESDEVLSFVSKLDDVPTEIKVEASKLILKDKWDVLRGEGFSEADLLRVERGRGSLDQVLQTIGRASDVVHGAGFKATGGAGEAVLEAAYGANVKGVDKQVWFNTQLPPSNPLGVGRYLDVFAGGIAHESKVEYVSYSSRTLMQIEKDAHLMQS